MAKRKKTEIPKLEPLEIIARLLGLIAVKGVEKEEAALQMSGAGLDDKAITELLGVSESYIRVARFNRKKKSGKTKKG